MPNLWQFDFPDSPKQSKTSSAPSPLWNTLQPPKENVIGNVPRRIRWQSSTKLIWLSYGEFNPPKIIICPRYVTEQDRSDSVSNANSNSSSSIILWTMNIFDGFIFTKNKNLRFRSNITCPYLWTTRIDEF